MDRLSHQPHTERGADAAHGIESRGAIGAQGFVQGFPRDPPLVLAISVMPRARAMSPRADSSRPRAAQ